MKLSGVYKNKAGKSSATIINATEDHVFYKINKTGITKSLPVARFLELYSKGSTSISNFFFLILFDGAEGVWTPVEQMATSAEEALEMIESSNDVSISSSKLLKTESVGEVDEALTLGVSVAG